jgi:uncharacterized delta-60 repeat protein
MSRPQRTPRTHRRRPLPAALALALSLLAPWSSATPVAADDGDLDLGFALFGRAVRGPGWASAVLARADGSLRVAIDRGHDVGVLALQRGGALDPAFGNAGVVLVGLDLGGANDDDAIELLERTDGRLLLVASAEDDDGERIALVQFTAVGALDPTFGTNGVRIVSTVGTGGGDLEVYAAALAADGKLLLAGLCNGCPSSAGADSFVGRLDAAGGLDPSFGAGGWALFDAVEGGVGYDYAHALTIDPAGRILAGGVAGLGGSPYVARLEANGELDLDFAGGDGVRVLPGLVDQVVNGLAVDPVRRRVVAVTGTFGAGFALDAGVARLTDGGALDGSFDGDGLYPMTLEEGTDLRRVAIQSDGKILVGGAINANGDQAGGVLLARFLFDGSLDPSFDGNGLKRIEFDLESGARDWLGSLVLAGGRVVAVGGASESAGPQVAILRTANALVFSDGFERGDDEGWPGD